MIYRTPGRFIVFLNLLAQLVLTHAGLSQITSPHVREVRWSPNGALWLDVEGDSGNYYRLVKFDFLLPDQQILDLGLISEGERVALQAPDIQANSFFRVEAINLNNPGDADRDGLDDRFELENPDFFNPLDSRDAYADFDGDGVVNRDEKLFGTSLFDPEMFPVRIASTSPYPGEDRVSASRKVILYFNQALDPCVLDFNPFTVLVAGQAVPGEWKLSSTGLFATFFPDNLMPASAEVLVTLDGDAVTDGGCAGIDADGDFQVGGSSNFKFRTLPLTRLDNTNVYGFVKDSFTGDPIEGVTILVDNIPFYTDVTDADGRFQLDFMPAPEFFVHIVGGTASDPPTGMTYPNIGKVFQSFPGQTVQIAKDGVPFDIYLPPLVDADYQTLSTTEPTDVVMGAGALANAANDFPDISPEEWDLFKIRLPANSAVNDQGVVSTQATVIPVPPDRIPEPLPSFLDMSLVVSIQIPGATFLDTPAPVTFPNTDHLTPGSKAYLFSFDHDSGQWKTIGTGTVSEDGLRIESDPGVGILAPGWHGVQPGTMPVVPPPDVEKDECEGTKVLMEWKDSMLTQLECAAELVPLDELAKLGVAGLGAADKIADGISQIASQSSTADTIQGTIKTLGALKGFVKSAVAEAGDENPAAKLLKIVECIVSISKETIEFGCELSKCVPEPYPGAQANQQALCAPLLATLEVLSKDLKTFQTITGGSVALDALCQGIDELTGYDFSQPSSGGVAKAGFRLSPSEDPVVIPESILLLLETGLRELEAAREFFQAQADTEAAIDQLSNHNLLWFEEVVSPILFAQGGYANVYFRIANDLFSYRGVSTSMGGFDLPIITADTPYVFEIYDPAMNVVASYEGVSAPGGVSTVVGTPVVKLPGLTDRTGDADDDGLTAWAELIIGTSDEKADTDEDGMMDGFEVREGLNPLDGVSYPMGVLANLDFDATVTEIVVNGSTAYLLSSEFDLSVVDLSVKDMPVLLGHTPVDGGPRFLKVVPEQNLLIIGSDASTFNGTDFGLYFFDISDPASPLLFNRTEFDPQALAVAPSRGLILAGNDEEVVLVDALTGHIMDFVGSANYLKGLGMNNTHAFVVVNKNLTIYDYSGYTLTEVGSLELPFGAPPTAPYPFIFDGDLMIVGTFEGLVTVDISDPTDPQIVGRAANTQLVAHHIESDGSGRIPMTSSNGGTITLQLSLYDLRDPTNVEKLLFSIDTPGRSYTLDLYEGLAFIADWQNGFSVLNYFSFGDPVAPGVFDFDLGYLDEDPVKAGIQILSDSTSYLEIRANHNYDVPLLRASLEVDGIEVARIHKGPAQFTIPVPRLDEGLDSETFSMVYKETRLNGASLTSDEVLLEVVGGTTPPSIDYASPESGVAYAGLPLLFRFDEFIDPDKFDLSKVEMLNLGPDRVWGGGDDFVVANESHLIFGLALGLYPNDKYPSGVYRLTLAPGTYGDLQGNTNSQPQIFDFEVFDTLPGTLIWTGGGDSGSFLDPTNWGLNQSPEGKSVFIPARAGPLLLSEEVSVKDFTVESAFTLESTGELAVKGSFLAGGDVTLTGNLFVSRLSSDVVDTVEFSGNLTLEGGQLWTQHPVGVKGDLYLSDGSILDFRESGTALNVEGTLSGANFKAYARDGATLSFSDFVDYVGLGNLDFFVPVGTLFQAEDPGSVISLPNLETITGPTGSKINGVPTVQFTASKGGQIYLPKLASNTGRIGFSLSGDGSGIELPLLSAIKGPDSQFVSEIFIDGGGVGFNAPLLKELSYCNLDVRNNGPYPFTQLESFGFGQFEVWTTTPDLGNLVTLEDASIMVRGGSEVVLGDFSSLVFTTARTWTSRDAGSLLRFPDLISVAGPEPESGAAFLKLEAWSEGLIDLTSLTTLTGGIHLSSRESGANIDLPVLAAMTSVNNFASKIEPRNGGNITCNTVDFANVTVDLVNEGILTGSSLSFTSDCILRGEGDIISEIEFLGKIELSNPTISITVTGSLELGATSIINPTLGLGSDKKQSGRLNVSDNVALNGTLDISPRNGWLPEVGDEVIVVFSSANGISGAFDSVSGLTDDDTFDLELSQTSGQITLKVIPKP